MTIEADAYELWGVTQNKDEDGNHYENRETVLSYKPDDAGDIEMRISEATPLYRPIAIMAWMDIDQLIDQLAIAHRELQSLKEDGIDETGNLDGKDEKIDWNQNMQQKLEKMKEEEKLVNLE